MALRSAWWILPEAGEGPASTKPQKCKDPGQSPHQGWPENSDTIGITFGELDKFLNANQRQRCNVEKFTYTPGASSRGRPLWKHSSSTRSVQDLVTLLQKPDAEHIKSTFFILRDASAEAVQALGYYLDITPRVFNFGFTMLSTGNTVNDYAFFGLQVIERYLPTAVSASTRARSVPHARFGNQEWHITMIAALFKKQGNRFIGIVHFQASDEAIADGMKILMTRDEEHATGEGELLAGQGQILAEIMYIDLSRRCVDGELTPTEQLKYMRDLHRLLPMWVAARRRINAAKDLNRGMCSHPFFQTNKMHDSFGHYLEKCNLVLDECVSRCDALTGQTENIINLIFNIATLQDTRASVEQSMAANASAASIRRVTLLTFIYLPLMLVASIFGMNVKEISQVVGQPPIWIFFASASSVLVVTLLAWSIWSRAAAGWNKRLWSI